MHRYIDYLCNIRPFIHSVLLAEAKKIGRKNEWEGEVNEVFKNNCSREGDGAGRSGSWTHNSDLDTLAAKKKWGGGGRETASCVNKPVIPIV